MINILIESKMRDCRRTTHYSLSSKPTKEQLGVGIGCFTLPSPLLVILSSLNQIFTLEVVCADGLSSTHLSKVSIHVRRMKSDYFSHYFGGYHGIQQGIHDISSNRVMRMIGILRTIDFVEVL